MKHQLLVGHVLSELAKIPDGSVQTCVCSPPYFGLRVYGLEPQVWGGDPFCEHSWESHIQPAANRIVHAGGMSGETLSSTSATRKPKRSAFCAECGAWKGDLGLEPTIALYLEHMVLIFAEVWRVLRMDGTIWVNMGDSRNGSGPRSPNITASGELSYRAGSEGMRVKGFKPKDLMGMPWRLAFALQDFGWTLRSDVVWEKKNPMPESAKDRPTTSHEYIFLLSKSAKYYYDAKAIAEPCSKNTHARAARGNSGTVAPGQLPHHGVCGKRAGVNPKAVSGWDNGKGSHGSIHKSPRSKQNPSFSAAVVGLVETRNKRSVWHFGTQAFKGKHFATFPEELPRTCILASTRQGDTVLDIFGGSGTTLKVTAELGRIGIYIDVKPEYAEMARGRLAGVTPPLGFEEIAS